MEVTKSAVFSPAPVSAEALGAFYLAALTEIQDTHHRLPSAAQLDLRFVFGADMTRPGVTVPLMLTATERTTIEERKTGFANLVHAMSVQPLFTGMTLEVKVVFKIPVSGETAESRSG
ncbi:uncharacterized protein BO80DRAFT_436668 [Aspergillus ibericus CBS 121593]|uniref:Uncharacterized protein n=1 Tax=Aspergillus ibericus CBS 121593 TaxID=1448316 RepID=A0A395GTJ4_9EURO|nr:hypothetical protein BO80DRAFT_436668 [Aspergillus ibericus CBS 121593]RAK98759.1 hypothetical protein BO80DRAFT_436668 [Aspergillus ibericus CBS 121593]